MRARGSAAAVWVHFVVITNLVACPSPPEQLPQSDLTGEMSCSTTQIGDSCTSSGSSTANSTGMGTEGSSSGIGEATDVSGTTGEPESLKMNGELCDFDRECESGKCHEDRGSGVCSECHDGAECRASGQGLACSILPSTHWYSCQNGGLGNNCELPESCQPGLHCAEGLPGWLSCSECESDGDCNDLVLKLCNPRIWDEVMDLGPYRACVAPASLRNGELCDLEGSGSMACQDFCSYGVQTGSLGVCGDCRPQEKISDCPDGERCIGPRFDGKMFVGATCLLNPDPNANE